MTVNATTLGECGSFLRTVPGVEFARYSGLKVAGRPAIWVEPWSNNRFIPVLAGMELFLFPSIEKRKDESL